MSIYNLDYSIFANEFLPPDKRADVQKSWQTALLAPEQQLHDSIFNVFRPYIIERSKQNGQKIVMESVLNDTFGVTAPPLIYIDNTGDDVGGVTFFNESEGYPGVIFYNESEGQAPTFFYNDSETVQNNDFKVYVPAAVYAAEGEAKIAAEVDRLRPYSTNYVIISY